MLTKRKLLYTFIAISFWFLIWEVTAVIINIPVIFPTVTEVFSALGKLVLESGFWKILLFSFVRILTGFTIGVIIGAALAILCNVFSAARNLFAPLMTVVRATPVASFIMVMWLIIGSDFVPSAITILMVVPIVWQNLTDGFSAIDKNLDEVCQVYEISGFKKFKLLFLPTLLRFLIPGIVTSASLAWKSGIAAEIIAYTKDSIGKNIFIAKNYLESAEMLAWTLVVIILSLLFEFAVSSLGKKVSNNVAGSKKHN